MAFFPTLSKHFDASSFEEEFENPNYGGSDMEGGYSYSRPRFTRKPRRMFGLMFKDITQTDKTALETFWNTHMGGSLAFTFVHPVTAENINCRFSKEMKLKFKRVGYGTNHRYDTEKIELQEV